MIPKKLTEQRDNLADNATQDGGDPYLYADGFDAACELLLPEMRQMAEALKKYKVMKFAATWEVSDPESRHMVDGLNELLERYKFRDIASGAITSYNTLMGDGDD